MAYKRVKYQYTVWKENAALFSTFTLFQNFILNIIFLAMITYKKFISTYVNSLYRTEFINHIKFILSAKVYWTVNISKALHEHWDNTTSQIVVAH